MRNFLVLCLLTLSFSVNAAELPKQVVLKSATRSFTHEFDVSIHEGKIWYRPRSAFGADSPKWELLGKTGLPVNPSPGLPGFGGFDSPLSVTQLSADGDNLIAIGNDGVIYYMKWSTRRWVNKWGQPSSKKLRLPEKIRSWSISHRGPFAGGYHDIDGNFHPISAGVTTLYVLYEDGLKIQYADPWLPADFSSGICGPLRNRFRARALAASASTLFVISDAGEMYTRLADYDTLGHNPFLAYSYERRVRELFQEMEVRTLPPEEWKKQPSIPPHLGQISSAITIFQTGKGNDARELRVEGVNTEGKHGFFSKPIHGATWSFIRTDLPLQQPLFSPGVGIPDLGPNIDQTLTGRLQLARLFEGEEYAVELKGFNPLCSGATLVVVLDVDTVEFPFLTVTSTEMDRNMKGAIILPAQLKAKAANNKVLREFIRKVFDGKTYVKIRLEIDEHGTVNVQSRSLPPLRSAVKMTFSKGSK